jgi:large subunit ribosomal protein L4
MKTSVYNQKGEVVGEVELNSKIFDVKPNNHLLAEAVRIQQSNARQGTANTKTRGEVAGGGKKPWKQKGTGRARAGSIRSPIWRHGGVTFGPRANRNWELKINKKAKTQALFMSLSDKAKENQFIVVDSINLEQPKTKEFLKVFGALEKGVSAKGGSASGGKTFGKTQMLVLPRKEEKLSRGSKNIKSVKYVLANSLNLIDVIKSDSIVVLKDSLAVIEKTYLKK